MIIKRYDDWKGDLSRFLEVGDYVDEKFVSHFLEVLPPATFTSRIIQIGEPYSHIDGRATFPTLRKTARGWRYVGNCFRGETLNQE